MNASQGNTNCYCLAKPHQLDPLYHPDKMAFFKDTSGVTDSILD